MVNTIIVVVVLSCLLGTAAGRLVRLGPSTSVLTFPDKIDSTYRGSWWQNTTRSIKQPDHDAFQERSGVVVFSLLRNTTTTVNETAGLTVIYGVIHVRDGEYTTERDLVSRLRGFYVQRTGRLWLFGAPLSDMERETVLADSGPDLERSATKALELFDEEWASEKADNMRLRFSMCPVVFRLQLSAVASNRTASYRDDLEIKGSGSCETEDCSVELQLDASVLQWSLYYAKVLRYVAVVVGTSAAQIYFTLKQMKTLELPTQAVRVSHLSIGMEALIDAFLCLHHLVVAIMHETLFREFVTVAFLQFFMFSLFEMRFLLLIWKASHPEAFNSGWEVMRREFSKLYTRFYACLIVGIFLAYQAGTRYMPWMVVLFYSFWVPQIVRTAILDTRHALNRDYLYGMSLTRLFIPLYVYGCPYNFFNLEPRPLAMAVLVLWVCAQVAMVVLQDRWHPRWIVPVRFRPEKYNYHRLPSAEGDSHEEDEEEEEEPCSICYVEFSRQDRPEDVMVTPCGHRFHTHCLSRWMDHKMECPKCRGELPAP